MAEPSPRGGAARGFRRARLRLAGGHRVTLLQNGDEFFPALIDSIDRACHSIALETYIFNDDPSGRQVASALARAAARGVSVRLVIDGFGTVMLEGEVARIIGASGVEVRVFRPFRTIIGMRLRVLRRLHRKLCVVDGSEAYVGGINVLDDRVDPRHGPLDAPRLDFAVRVVGPLVAHVDESMGRLWIEASAYPDRDRVGGSDRSLEGSPCVAMIEGSQDWPTFEAVHAALVLRDNVRNRRTIERIYLRALGRAKREVLIASAYFLPGRRFRRALCAAARRGVRVRLLLQGRVEYRLPHLGALSLYESLLRDGVEIIEYRSSFLHAKVAIADDWVTVGSANIDPFSLLLAREANIVVRSGPFAQALRSRLDHEIQTGGQAVELDNVTRVPFWRRLVTRAAWLMMRIGVAISGSGLRY